MSRGNRKALIFEDDEDRQRFLAILTQTADRFEIRYYAYCLMGNHYHLVFDTPRGNLSAVMRYINGVYAQSSNRRHHRTGHLFEGRFRSIVIQRESYLRRVARYVVLNPVRAGLASAASAWPWSSYRATVGPGPAPGFIVVDWIDTIFGGSRQEAQRRFALYVNDTTGSLPATTMESPGLGSQAFRAAIRAHHETAHPDRLLPRHCKALGRPSLERLFESRRSPRPVRNGVIREAHVTHGYRLAEIATFLDLHPSTPSAIIRRLKPDP